MPELQISDLTLRFGGVTAIDSVSFSVPHGQLCALVGPNGAGKSSLFNCVTGLYRASAGSVRWDGRELVGLAPHRIARTGVARTFQNIAFAPSLTVMENVLLAASVRERSMPFACGLRTPWLRAAERADRTEALRHLDRIGLVDVADADVEGLPFGTRKRIEIARALMCRPRLLLIDEPAGGLDESEVAELGELLGMLRTEHDLSILLVEHHMGFVTSVAERIVVLDGGRKIADGAPADVVRDPAVVEAYLGTAA